MQSQRKTDRDLAGGSKLWRLCPSIKYVDSHERRVYRPGLQRQCLNLRVLDLIVSTMGEVAEDLQVVMHAVRCYCVI